MICVYNQVRNFALGYYRVDASGEDIKRLWNMCAFHGIDIWDLSVGEHSYFFSFSIKNLGVFGELVKKTDVTYRIILEAGIPYLIGKIRKNWSFFFGAFVAMWMMFILSQFIWSIRIEGNTGYGEEELLRFLEEQDVTHGMLKNKIVCSDLAASLREQFPNITWVTAKIEGTNLIIDMKENILEHDLEKYSKGVAPSNLVAEKDGIIVKMITRTGTPLMTPGMKCKKGDVLVEGVVPIYNDSQEIVRYEYVIADADIEIQCSYFYYDEFPRNYEEKVYQESQNSVFLQIGGWRMGILYKKQNGEEKRKIREYHQLKLTNTFLLPVYYGKEELRFYKKTDLYYSEESVKILAEKHLSLFLKDLEKKGVQIYENNVKIEMTDAKCTTKGEIVVVEKTGKHSSFSPGEFLTAQPQEE